MTINLSPFIINNKGYDFDAEALNSHLDELDELTEGRFFGINLNYRHSGPDEDEQSSIINGPCMMIFDDSEDGLSLGYDLPIDDGVAATLGRLIQRAMSNGYIDSALDEIVAKWPIWAKDQETSVILTRNALFFYKEDVWRVIEEAPPATSPDTAAMLLCSIIPRKAQSAHDKIALARRILTDIDTFQRTQEDGLVIMASQGVAKFTAPPIEEIATRL